MERAFHASTSRPGQRAAPDGRPRRGRPRRAAPRRAARHHRRRPAAQPGRRRALDQHAAQRGARAPRGRPDDEHRQQPRADDPPQDAQPEALRRRDRRAHDRLRHRPAGTGKTYLAMAKAVAALQAKQVKPHHPHPAGGRGGGAARLPAGDAQRQIDPTCARCTTPCTTWSTRSRSRGSWPPGRSRSRRCLHARSQPQRRLHHPRRGAEHLARADEDVPHPPRLRLEDGRHRRHQPGRPAERTTSVCGSLRTCATSSTASTTSTSPS